MLSPHPIALGITDPVLFLLLNDCFYRRFFLRDVWKVKLITIAETNYHLLDPTWFAYQIEKCGKFYALRRSFLAYRRSFL
jgi:hypothetical protein|tara:strand:- start:2211 stop:2450 length:240 start_codon:yes stop_codon:yes gene_type:complete